MRQKIITEALRLFAQNGYEGVTVREIAAAVGIKGASIYNHFESKKAIFYAVFEEVTRRYDATATALSIPAEDSEEAAERFAKLGEEQMQHLAKALFSFFAKDELVVQFRKVLVAEQNRNELAARSLQAYYFDAPLQYQTGLFEKMQQAGAFPGYDPRVMALHFYTPVYFLLSKFDLEQDYEACMAEVERHVHWFMKLYGHS